MDIIKQIAEGIPYFGGLVWFISFLMIIGFALVITLYLVLSGGWKGIALSIIMWCFVIFFIGTYVPKEDEKGKVKQIQISKKMTRRQNIFYRILYWLMIAFIVFWLSLVLYQFFF
jgi:VIT1/CCC1 family predicted Fe2+/Mn2+ transporter